jgi:hypothetical protein
MTDTTTARDIARLKRSVWILGAAVVFFAASAVIHLAQVGSLRAIDIVLLPVGALFAAYLRRLRAAKARAGR